MKKFFFENRNKFIAAAAAIILLLILWRIGGYLQDKPAQEKIIPTVRTVTAGTTAAGSPVFYPGEVKGRYESTLAFQVPGKIIKRSVNVGDSVKAGQILFTLDPVDIRQKVEAAAAAQSSAAANYRLAAENASRFARLYEGGAVSKATLDNYNTQLEAAEAALRQAAAMSNEAANQLEYTVLRSDAEGVIAAVYGETGQLAAQGAPMATIVENGELEIRMNVSETALSGIHAGQKAEVSFWALPGTTVNAQVREISPIADPVTRTYTVKATLLNPPPEVLLGMTAKAVLADDKRQASQKLLVLPSSAVYRVNAQPHVWLVKNGRVESAAVEIAGYKDNDVIISGGIGSGDVVVTAGLSKLIRGQEVRIAKDGE